ncbi:MAG: phosphoenolpyruvate--protein phosphotransferase [Ruminococcus sp.]
MYKGIGGSAGIGIGKVMRIIEQSLDFTPKTVSDTGAELTRYRNAVSKFCQNTETQAEQLKESAGEKEAEIIMGHILMIQDPYMNGEIENSIKSGNCAEQALTDVCNMFITVFSSADDELTQQRATDVKDIKNGILSILLGIEEVKISDAPKGTVLVAKDLTPSMTAGINKDNVVGIVTEVGGKTSHSAILARALEIPAVLSIQDITSKLSDGDTVIVDGSDGVIIESPAQEKVIEYSEKRNAFLKEKAELAKYMGKPTQTEDGIKVELVGNIGKPEDANKVVECDGEGIGLFRTEFLFMDRDKMPTEEEQFDAYKKVALIMKGKPVIIRTLDVGGDKDIPYLGLTKEENPFMGFRAVRYCLKNIELYKTQLRALLRASAFGGIKIMVPLVVDIEELRSVKAIVKEIMSDLDNEGIAYNKDIEIGVMIETPAASLIADLLAQEADFFSIGTNDLTGYTMCVDRGNADVAYLYSPFQPAVLRSIKHIIECGNEKGIMVGMCGEAAADPKLIPLLISFGLKEFSVSATSVLATRKAISKWSKAEADKVAQKVMDMTSEKDVIEYLNSL